MEETQVKLDTIKKPSNVLEVNVKDIPPIVLSDKEVQEYADKYSQVYELQELSRKFPLDPALLAFLYLIHTVRNAQKVLYVGDSFEEITKRANFYYRMLPSNFFKTFKKLFEDLGIDYKKESLTTANENIEKENVK